MKVVRAFAKAVDAIIAFGTVIIFLILTATIIMQIALFFRDGHSANDICDDFSLHMEELLPESLEMGE